MLQGLFLFFSAAVIVINLVADLLYGYLDPRVRYRVSTVAPRPRREPIAWQRTPARARRRRWARLPAQHRARR